MSEVTVESILSWPCDARLRYLAVQLVQHARARDLSPSRVALVSGGEDVDAYWFYEGDYVSATISCDVDDEGVWLVASFGKAETVGDVEAFADYDTLLRRVREVLS